MRIAWWRRMGAVLLGAAAGCGAAQTVPAAQATPAAQAVGEAAPPMLGFSAAGAAAEAALERRFDAELSAAELRTWMQRLSSAPNQVGSPHDKANAEFIAGLFRSWGWETSIETFSVLYPTPREVTLEMTAPTHVVAKLREPPVPGDTTSVQVAQELPPYNVYGADGDVRGELVYVNQGMPEDYLELERQGVSVAGRVVIVRYGGGWRGLKPRLAYEHGAIGCLIYSDPRDDGYGRGDVYPRGGFRPPDAVQRGSVQDITIATGDPLTPGVGATPDAKRLPISEAKTLLKIPVLPISYADAEPLLAALGGRVAPERWRGGLPIAYHVGPGPATVHLRIRSDWSQKPLYDVIAILRGTQEPDRWIVRGNHHDAWVFGATDPFAGHVALLAEAKAIGVLARQGCTPRRTLVYASGDGEEPGLLGSTEWVETHAAELAAKAALYVNSDTNGRGALNIEGSHVLQRYANEVARDVRDPETGASVLARAVAVRRVKAFESGLAADPSDELSLGALGSGSDYTPFLQHLGISSLDVVFGGEADYGVYHSAYDSFDHYRRFVDPTFDYGVALAQVVGRLVLRAAQADLLPAREGDFAASVQGYDEQLHKLVDDMRAKTGERTHLLEAGAYALASDPARPRAPPPLESPVPHLNFSELDNAIERLKVAAQAFDREYARVAQNPAAASEECARLNAALGAAESALTDAPGLPDREWYKHMIYAPGRNTGYGAKTLPGIREAIEERRWADADHYVKVVAHALDGYSDRLERALAVR